MHSTTAMPRFRCRKKRFICFKTTEVQVTGKLAESPFPATFSVSAAADDKGRLSFTSQVGQYSVIIIATPLIPASLSPTSKTRMLPSSAPSFRTDMRRRKNRAAMEANTAAWSYTKGGILLIISPLVTWVPSSIDRLYSLVHPELISVLLTCASAIVLPLIGFWNFVISITISWAACKMLCSSIFRGEHDTRLSRTISGSRTDVICRHQRTNSTNDDVTGLAAPYRA